MQPIISVLIPTYRRPEKLARALESISAATACRTDVVVIDDCPEGSAFEVARRYGARYVFKAGVHRGQSYSRNMGLELALGEWVCFLDDDDFLVSDGIDQLIARAPQHAPVVLGDYFTFNISTRTEVSLAALEIDHLLVCNRIPMGSYLMRRSVIERPFDVRMRSHEDWDFLLSNVHGKAPAHIPVTVVGIDKTENLTNSTEGRRRKLFWLDFLSVYARFPASHLSSQRSAMLQSLGLNMPSSLLDFDDLI